MLRNRERGKFKPPSDVIETDDKFVILVEIAGMKSDEFKLSLMNRKLVIIGVRTLPAIAPTSSYHLVEIERGEFKLVYELTKPVDGEQVKASYVDGLLQVELPYLPKKTVTVVTANENKKD